MIFETDFVLILRGVNLGARAPGSYREFLKISKSEEAQDDQVSASRMIEMLTSDHENIVKRLEQFRADADEMNDNTSVAIYDGLISFHQKAAWRISSHRG